MSDLENKANELLVDLLDKTTSAMEKGADFLGEQIPLVVQELLLFKTVWYSVLVIGLLVWAFFGQYFSRKLYRSMDKDDVFDGFGSDGAYMLIGIVWVVSFVLPSLIAFNKIHDLVMVTLAPRLYLLEYAAQLTK